MKILGFYLVIAVGWGSNIVAMEPRYHDYGLFKTLEVCQQYSNALEQWRLKQYSGKINPKIDSYCIPQFVKPKR